MLTDFAGQILGEPLQVRADGQVATTATPISCRYLEPNEEDHLLARPLGHRLQSTADGHTQRRT
jgi:hypothetical protein